MSQSRRSRSHSPKRTKTRFAYAVTHGPLESGDTTLHTFATHMLAREFCNYYRKNNNRGQWSRLTDDSWLCEDHVLAIQTREVLTKLPEYCHSFIPFDN